MVCVHKNKLPKKLINTDKSFQIFDTITDLPTEVVQIITHFQNKQINYHYLLTLENNTNSNIELKYAVITHKQQLEQVLVLQLYKFDLSHFAVIKAKPNACNLFSVKGILNQIFVTASNCNNAHVLVIGNLFFSSETQTLTQAQFDWLITELKNKLAYNCIVVKDIRNPLQLTKKKLIDVPVEPSMELAIATNWHTFDDYLQDLLPKYKKRWNNTINKNFDLQIEFITNENLATYIDDIYSLYLNVFNSSNTLYNKIAQNYFLQMKNKLQDAYQIFVYKFENKVVGFGSYIIDNENLFAEYVGFEMELNKKLKIYQTILYQYVSAAINNQCKKVYFGRTGIEIKSTIGAVPVNYHNYLICNNSILHQTAKLLIKDIKQPNWIYRQPFKENRN